MNFFQQLQSILDGTKKVTIVATKKGEALTVGFFPEFSSEEVNEKTKMVSLTGTADEMDEGFFNEIRKPIDAVTAAGLKSNADEVAKEVGEAAKEEAEESKKPEAKSSSKKPAPKKKPIPAKKPEPPKKQDVKKPEPAKKAAEVKSVPAPKKKSGAPEKVDPHHQADLDETLLPEEPEISENGNNSPEQEINTTVQEINGPDSQMYATDVELAKDRMDQAEKEEETAVNETNSPEEPEPTELEKKFEVYMSDAENLMKEKKYQEAKVTYENARVLADAEDNQELIERAKKGAAKAQMWVKAMANLLGKK